jgi:CrcB protein
MMNLLYVGLGGFFGAVARYGLSGLVQDRATGPVPVGTLTVNVLGCLLIGLLMYMITARHLLGPQTRLFLMIGLLGSFTTFSTVGYETFHYLRLERFGLALANIGANILLGLGAVAAGWIIGKLITG